MRQPSSTHTYTLYIAWGLVVLYILATAGAAYPLAALALASLLYIAVIVRYHTLPPQSQTDGDRLRLRLADQVTHALNHAVELDEVLQTACEGLVKTLGYTASATFVADDDRHTATAHAWAGNLKIARRFSQVGQPLTGWSADISSDTRFARFFHASDPAPIRATNLSNLLNDLSINPVIRRLAPVLNTMLGLQEILITPVVISGQVWAALIVASRRALDEHDLDVIQVLAGQAALAIDRAQRHAQMRQRNRELARRTNQLSSLQAIVQAATATLDPRHVMETVAQGMVEHLGYRAALVSTFDAADNCFTLGAVHPGGTLLERATKLAGLDPWSLKFHLDPQANPGFTRLLRGEVWISSRFHDYVKPAISQPVADAMQALYGTHCNANVPMWVRGQLVGALTVATQAESIDQEDQEILATAARQVGLAIENARLYQQAQDERARLQLLYDVGQQLTSQLEIEQLLPVLVDTIVQSVGASKGGILVFDPKGQITHRILIREYASEEQTQRILDQVLREGLAGQAVRERRSILTPDMHACSQVVRMPNDPREANIRSLMNVPLLLPDRVVGLLTLIHPQPNYFNPAHLEAMETLAAQATTVLENARLYEETARNARQQRAVAEAARALNAHLDVKAAFPTVVKSIRALVDAGRISLALLEDDQEHARFIALDRPRPELAQGTTLPLSDTAVTDDVLAGRPHLTPDLSAKLDYPAERALYQAGIRSHVSLPLTAGDQILGALNLSSQRTATFSARDLPPLQQIADALAIALANSRLVERVSDSELRYRTLTEHAPIGIFSTDATGHVSAINPALIELLDRPDTEALVGLNILEFAPLKRAGLTDHFRRALEKGETADQEIQYTTSEGTQLHIRLKLAPEHDHSGAISIVVGLVENISERAALEQLREDLRAMLIHDLRQPLAIIYGALALLEQEPLTPDVQQMVRDALSNAHRQQMLIDAYLDVTRLEAGQIPFVLLPTPWPSVEKLARHILDTVQAMAERRELTTVLDLPSSPPQAGWQVALDTSAIERVLVNLLDNAIKFCPPGTPPITLRLQPQASGLTIKVADQGRGISADKLATIFDRFAQARDAERMRGTGLGLTFCRLAVQAHNGQITVESVEGQGSTFSVWLPAK